jgi:hypothetical protein
VVKPVAVPGASRLETRRKALLTASETLFDAKNRAARAKYAFVRATGAEAKRKARKLVEEALSDLRVATLEYQAATFNLRRELTPDGRKVLDDLLARLERRVARYEEASRRFAEVSAAYESAREHYMRERAALGRSRVPPGFDALLAKLESALAARDKSIALAHGAHRETLGRLEEAMSAHDQFTRKPNASTRLRRNAAWDAARRAFGESDRHTGSLTDALEGWFEADKDFSLQVAALEATRGIPQVHRLEARAFDMLRASARLTLSSILTDEAAQALAATMGEVKLLR